MSLTETLVGILLTASLSTLAYFVKQIHTTVRENRKRTDYLLGIRGVGDNDGAFGEIEEQLKEARVAREEDHREMRRWLTELDERLDRLAADVAAIRSALNHSDIEMGGRWTARDTDPDTDSS